MFQAIAEVVKQSLRNIGNSGKNAQVNGSTANGGVNLLNNDFKKTDSNNNEHVKQTTENENQVETTKQEPSVESSEGDTSNNGLLNNIASLKGKSFVMSDEKTKDSKDVSSISEKTNEDKSDEEKEEEKRRKTEETKRKINDKRKAFGEMLANSGKNAQVENSVVPFNPITPTVVSDERLKDIFGEETPIDCFAKIHSYEFKYTPEAQEMMQGENHVDDKEHLGVMAQELLMNPATSACVIKDTDGFLKVDTAQLTMANTATIAELSRKVQKLEEMLGER